MSLQAKLGIGLLLLAGVFYAVGLPGMVGAPYANERVLYFFLAAIPANLLGLGITWFARKGGAKLEGWMEYLYYVGYFTFVAGLGLALFALALLAGYIP